MKGYAKDQQAQVGSTQYYKLLFTYPTGVVESDMYTATIPAGPQGITNLRGTSPSPGTANLAWTCDPEAIGYSLRRQKGKEAVEWIRPAGSAIPTVFPQCEYTDTGLWNGSVYTYTVVGVYPDANTSSAGSVAVNIAP